jgi:hypothetical protein
LEEGGFGCGDDHIPTIDCMKIFCREGKKENGRKNAFGLQLSQRDSVLSIGIR